MPNESTEQKKLVAHPVWDRTTRWFHWINVLCIIGLSAIGSGILFEDDLGFSPDGIVLMKTVHVYIGYVFALNLVWRIIWAFIGSRYARWKAILPFRSGFTSDLRQYRKGFISGKAPTYLGHNPVGRLMIGLLLALMFTQAVTGLMLASTDLYKLPFGSIMAEWVTAGDAEKLANLKPGSKEFIDQAGYDEMRAFRKPFKVTHEYVFYFLLASIALHVIGNVFAEVKYKQGLISAMFSGQKTLSETPVDEDSKS